MSITSQSYQLDPDTREWVFEDGRRIPVFAGGDDGGEPGDPNDPEGKPGGEGDPGQQDGKTPSQPGKAKEKGAAPWAQDLEAMRGHEDPFSAFDEYLRTKVQPRMTQHEQSVAEFNRMFGDMDTARLVSQLMSDLDGNPKETLKRLAQGFGVDPVDLLDVLEDAAEEDPNGPQADGKTPADPEDPRLAWAQQQMEQEQQRKEDEALENLLGGLEDKIEGFNRDLYVRILASENYDAEAALEAYMPFHREPEAKDDPPPTGGGQKGSAPREARKYNGPRPIAEAMAGFFRDEAVKAR